MPTAEALVARLRSNPADRAAYEQLTQLYRHQRDYQALVDLMASWAGSVGDAVAASNTYVEIADVLRELGDEPQAQGYYGEALRQWAGNTTAIERLASAWRQQGQHDRVSQLYAEMRGQCVQNGDAASAIELLQQQLATERQTARRVMLLRELADLARAIGDLDRAVVAAEQVVQLVPDDVDAAHQLAEALAERATGLEGQQAADDHERVASLLTTVAVRVDPERARAFLESALGYAPWHDGALSALERLLEGTPDETALAVHWVGYLGLVPEGARADRRRVRLAHAYALGGQIDDALYCLEPALASGDREAAALAQQLRSGAVPSAPVSRSSAPPSSSDDADVNTEIGDSDMIERLRRQAQPSERPSDDVRRTRSMPPTAALLSGPSSTPAPPPPPRASSTSPPPPPPRSSSTRPPPPRRARSQTPRSAPPAEVDSAQLKREAAAALRAGRTDAGVEMFRRVLVQTPDDVEAFDALDAHLRRTQDHASRVDLLLQSVALATTPPALARARSKEAALLYESRLRDFDGAVRVWRQIIERDPSDPEAARAIRRLLEQAQQWDELAHSIEREIEEAASPEARLSLLRRLRGVHRDQRGDIEAAVVVSQRLLELVPNDRALRDALIEDLLSLGRVADAAPLLEQQINEAPSRAKKVQLLRKLADVYRDAAGDATRAHETYDRILEINPKDEEAFAASEALARSLDDHQRLLAVLERHAEALTGPRAAELLFQAAAVAEQIDDAQRGIDLLTNALEIAPQEGRILDALCSLYERGGLFEDLVELLRERAILERHTDAKIELLRRLARVLGERLSDAAGELEAWQQILALRDDVEALGRVRAHAIERDDPALLADTLGRLAAVERDVQTRRTLRFDRAKLLLERLERPKDASAELTRLLADDTSFEPAMEALREACKRAKDYGPLAQILDRRWEATEDPALRAQHARELADLHEGPLPDEERAMRALMRWAEAAPTDPTPHRRLVPLLEARRRHRPLLAALDALSEHEEDAAARVQAGLQAAQVALKNLRDLDGGWHRLATLLERGADEAEAPLIGLAKRAKRLDAACDLLEASGRHVRLLALLQERLADERDTRKQVPLLRRIAQVQIDYLQDEAAALVSYRALLEIQEDADALRFLQVIAAREDDIETLADCLRRLAPLEADPTERRELLLEHARLLRTRLDKPKDAVRVLRRLFGEHPDHAPLVEELLEACVQAGDDRSLAATLESLVQRETDLARRADYARQLADVYERHGDSSRAIDALTVWAASDPNDVTPHQRLRPLLERASRNEPLLVTLDALARLEPDAQVKVEANVAAARLAAGPLQDAEGGWQRLVPFIAEAHAEVDHALADIATAHGRLDELYVLQEQAGRHEALVELLEMQVERERDVDKRVELYRNIARLASDRLGDDSRAAAAWNALLELREDAEALRFVRTRAVRIDDAATLVDVTARLAALETDRDEKRDLLFEQGHLLRMRLEQPTEAAILMRQIIEELDPEFEPALDELALAAEAAGDPANLAYAWERLRPVQPDPEARLELTQKLIELYEHDAGDLARARALYEEWIAEQPADPEPRRRLLELLQDAKDVAGMLVQLDALSQVEHGVDACVDAQRRAALLAYEAGDSEGAWQRAVPLAQADDAESAALVQRIAFETGALDALEELHAARGTDDAYVIALRERCDALSDTDEKVALLRRMARVLGERLDDSIAAGEVWNEVLALREDADALQHLRTAAERAEDPDLLEDALRRLAVLQTEPTARAALTLERALLLQGPLARPDEAIPLLRDALSVEGIDTARAAAALVEAAEEAGDAASLAIGIEHQLATTTEPMRRALLARQLADICEGPLDDAVRAAVALRAWAEAEPDNLEVHERLRPHAEAAKDLPLLLRTLDALATLSPESEARVEAVLAAAELCERKLRDRDGAWQRLAPLALEGEAAVEEAARAFAKRSSQPRLMANLLIMRAQRNTGPRAAADWSAAAEVLEQAVGAPAEALEARLRALATDTTDRDALSQVERLAVANGAWDRLAQVYDHLIQQAPDAASSAELLLRHAEVLLQHGGDRALALDRLIAACKAAPNAQDALDRAEAVAASGGANSELLWIIETRLQTASDDAEIVRLSLRAAEVADIGLGEREQALATLQRALSLVGSVPEVVDEAFAMAEKFDRARPDLGKEDARRALLRAQLDQAWAAKDPTVTTRLVLHAAKKLRTALRDPSAAFDALKRGVANAPGDAELLDAVESIAVEIGRLDALDAHLARLIAQTDGKDRQIALLRRRGRLQLDKLDRAANAADSFAALLKLDADDEQAADQLAVALERAGRYQELLRALEGRLERTSEVGSRVELLRRLATLWEVQLKNRPNALDRWNQLRDLAPNDRGAAEAIARLQS